jgi:hypothetical protein
MSSTPKVFKNRCDYRSIDGTICNKKCIDTKCSSHKKCESYTIQCIYRDASGIQCSRYTRSKVCKCSQHARCPIPKLDETVKQDEPVEEDQTEKIDDTVKHVKPNAVEGENTKTAKTSKPSAASSVTPSTTAGSYAIVEPMNRKMQLARAAKQMKAEQRLSEITKKIKQVQVNDDESDEDDDE